jgi:hypothetical protein
VTSPNAKCIDGTAPAYYWRDGVGADSKKVVIFLEGGGWSVPHTAIDGAVRACKHTHTLALALALTLTLALILVST